VKQAGRQHVQIISASVRFDHDRFTGELSCQAQFDLRVINLDQYSARRRHDALAVVPTRHLLHVGFRTTHSTRPRSDRSPLGINAAVLHVIEPVHAISGRSFACQSIAPYQHRERMIELGEFPGGGTIQGAAHGFECLLHLAWAVPIPALEHLARRRWRRSVEFHLQTDTFFRGCLGECFPRHTVECHAMGAHPDDCGKRTRFNLGR